MAKEVKVLVACGSGVATSTIAQEEIKDIAKNAGVKIRLMKGTISEVPMKQKDVDVVFTTANYRNPLEKPHLSVFGLVSGRCYKKESCRFTSETRRRIRTGKV